MRSACNPMKDVATWEDFTGADEISKTSMLRDSVSLKKHIIDIIKKKGLEDADRDPFNISLDSFSNDGRMGMFFRYGFDTVVSIYFDEGSLDPRVSFLRATAPICAGDGRVIYTKRKPSGDSHVYENGINLLGPEKELCHSISSSYEKNWGCFNRNGKTGEYYIVYSVFPLRIFQVDGAGVCTELPALQTERQAVFPVDMRVKQQYSNFDEIEKMFVPDLEGTSIFRGGSRGVKFGDEHLFVGHVTLEDGESFPHRLVDRNITDEWLKGYPRMYYMFFYTLRLSNGMVSVSRISSCFQPPSSDGFQKIVFPCGISYRESTTPPSVVVSYGRNDNDCLLASFSPDEINTLLVPIGFWNTENYVLHPNYATSLRHLKPVVRSVLGVVVPKKSSVGLLGTSDLKSGVFNPAITSIGNGKGKFLTAWRKFLGDTESWEGYNHVAIEACSLSIKDGKLRYAQESETVSFQVGTTTTGGEDPRLITENGCPLLMINDLDRKGNRRMYVHNIDTDHVAMTIHPFCHNISDDNIEVEKNWGPFYHDGQLHFVYSVDPLVVAKASGEHKCPSPTPSNIECQKISTTTLSKSLKQIFEDNGLSMRGGSPGIHLENGEYLFVGHSVQHDGDEPFADYLVQRSIRKQDTWHKEYPKMYSAFFFTIREERPGEWEMKRLSCCSHFPGKQHNFTKIVFPGGLAEANLGNEFEDAFVVSFGERDKHGGFSVLNRKFLDCVLRPVGEWNSHNFVVDVNYFQNILSLNPSV